VPLEVEEENIPKSVNAVIRHLDKETENITLSDLNSARQAIAKVETLIELEKKLTELEKVQKERENKSGSPSAVPASMLMPAVATQPAEMPRFVPPPASMMSDIDIDRIVGGAGEYKAVIKSMDGTTKAVSIGDTLPDGAVVTRISSSGMEITHGDTKQTIHVKNVDMVFGVAP
jgi:type IV pilus biogenesis protein PilP